MPPASSRHATRSSTDVFTTSETIHTVAAAAHACSACASSLPLGPRPVFQAGATARLMIVGQAPGTKVHATGIPWNDPSGDRLRDWLCLDRAQFYDETAIAIVSLGLCYPGRLPRGGDAPPRHECAPLWQARFRAALPDLRLTLLVGSYAQAYYLGKGRMEDRIRNHRRASSGYFPLPHPSWRTRAWAAHRPWFETETIPALRAAVIAALAPKGPTSCPPS